VHAAWLLVVGLAFAPVWAGQSVFFDLAADELGRSLLEFTRQSGIPCLYFKNQAKTLRTQPVVGEFEPLEALRRMLEGTHLHPKVYENPLSFVAVPDEEPVQTPSSTPDPLESSSEPLDSVTIFGSGPVRLAEPSDEVLITGTPIHTAMDVTAPVMSVTPQDFSHAPYNAVQDSLYQLPLVSLNGPREDLQINSNYQFGAGINLRGLGVGATLVLVNGRRQPVSGLRGEFVDVTGIPASAVERVEVLPDGSSASYGSDAVGGVVNVILRDDLTGAQTQARFRSDVGGRNETTLSQLFGAQWVSGKAMIVYEYTDATPLAASSRGYAANADKRPFGGRDWRSIYGDPGNLFNPAVPGQLYGISLSGGSSATPVLTSGGINLENPFSHYDLFPERVSHSFYVNASQRVSDGMEFFAEARVALRDVHATRGPSEETLLVPSTNPFFTAATPGTTNVAVTHSFLRDLGPDTLSTETREYVAAIGTRLRLPRDWMLELSGSYGKDVLRSQEYNLPDPYALDVALADTDPATAFNPFGVGSQTSSATLQAIRLNRKLSAGSQIADGILVADGPLWQWPSGIVRLAVGLERRQEISGQDVPILEQSTDRFALQEHKRVSNSGFAELALPVLGDAASVHASPRLELSLAMRVDEYSDYGSRLSPSGRARWSPARSIRLRASWGQSFRVPPLEELYDSSQNDVSFVYLPDPRVPSGHSLVLVESGTSQSLRAETATTLTAGLDWVPMNDGSFQVSGTWFNINYRNRIAQPALDDPADILVREAEWTSFVTRNPTAPLVTGLCESPLFAGSRLACLGSAPAAVVDYRLTNLSLTREAGVDLNVKESVHGQWGNLRFSVDAEDLFRFDQTPTAVSAPQSVLNTVGNPIALRLRATTQWAMRRDDQPGPGVGAAVNYSGGYANPESALEPHVRSATTLDLQLFEALTVDRWWGVSRVSLNILNVFNQGPPHVDNPYGYDIANFQPLSRVISLFVGKDW